MKSWKDIQGFFDFTDLYDQAVVEARDGDVLIELGLAWGRSIAYLAEVVRQSGKDLRVVGVDHFQHVDRGEFSKNLRECGLLNFIEVIQESSDLAADLFEPASAFFVFVDADHSFEAVKRDLLAWHSKVRPGGMIAGHDRLRPGVHQAVIEVLGSYNPSGKSSWWVRV